MPKQIRKFPDELTEDEIEAEIQASQAEQGIDIVSTREALERIAQA